MRADGFLQPARVGFLVFFNERVCLGNHLPHFLHAVYGGAAGHGVAAAMVMLGQNVGFHKAGTDADADGMGLVP